MTGACGVEAVKGKKMIGNNYKVDAISKPLADDFLQRHHYLAQQGKGFMGLVNYGLFDARGSFVGCVVFSGISVIETLIGCFDGFTRESDQSGFYELARLAMDDEKKERNLTSWFLSRCIRKLRHENHVRAIISYADSKYHNGYIYQATNFHYYGLTDQKTDFFVNVGGGTTPSHAGRGQGHRRRMDKAEPQTSVSFSV